MNIDKTRTEDLDEWKRAKEAIAEYYRKEFGKVLCACDEINISDFVPLAYTTLGDEEDITIEAGIRIHYDYNNQSHYEFVRHMSDSDHHATFIDRYFSLKDLNECVLIGMHFDQLIYVTEGERYLFDFSLSNLEVIYYND